MLLDRNIKILEAIRYGATCARIVAELRDAIYTWRMNVTRFYETQIKPSLRKDLLLRVLRDPGQKSCRQLITHCPVTLVLTSTIIALHGLRSNVAAIEALHALSGFRPEHITGAGTLLCGFFHEGAGHFMANVLALILCAGLAEALLGARVMLLALLFGFWAANPLTVGILSPLLSRLAPEQWTHLMAEVDYGASNGIYAVVGVLAALLIRPRTILLPFIFNGVFYAIAASSWLALQHVIALFGGLWIGKYWMTLMLKRHRVPSRRSPHAAGR